MATTTYYRKDDVANLRGASESLFATKDYDGKPTEKHMKMAIESWLSEKNTAKSGKTSNYTNVMWKSAKTSKY